VRFERSGGLQAGTSRARCSASAIARARFLLVVTCRPEYNVPWANRPYSVQCRLDALSDSETRAFLADALGTDPALADIKDRLAGHCEGNPLFLEECVRTLIETGNLVGNAGAYTVGTPFVQVSTPATVQGILAARIDRLTPRRRYVLQAAAVMGRSFSGELLAAVIERPPGELREALAELEAAEFVSLARLTPVREYQFVHAVTQQVTYGGMLQGRRTALHRAVGIALQRQAGDRVREVVETIADHFDNGELWDEALRAVSRRFVGAAVGRCAGLCRAGCVNSGVRAARLRLVRWCTLCAPRVGAGV
jgi:predicted ATPase